MRDTCRQHRLVGFATIPSHQMSHDAFISYSTHDKAAADATCAALEGSGIRCWIAPRDIVPGAEWGEAIIEGINHCRVLILIFSANANDSPQIRREVERAVSKGVPIIPLRIQDIAPTRSLEYFIGTVHWLDALTPPLETHLRRLAETVKALLQIDPAPPRIVSPSIVSGSPASWIGANGRVAAAIALTCLGLTGGAIGLWRFVAVTPGPQAPAPPSTLAQPAAQPSSQALIPSWSAPSNTRASSTITIGASSIPSSRAEAIAWSRRRKRTAPTNPPAANTAPPTPGPAACAPGPTAPSAMQRSR